MEVDARSAAPRKQRPPSWADGERLGSRRRWTVSASDSACSPCPADNLAEKVEYYAPQLQAYRRALALMTNLPEADIAAQLLFLKLGRVCTVPLEAD